MNTENEIKLVFIRTPSEIQAKELFQLRKMCFADADETEVEEDFYHPRIIQVLAYIGGRLVGCAGVHITEQVYDDQKIKIGGYSICTHPEWRRQGVASKVIVAVMQYLADQNCDIGFLSVNPENEGSVKLHQKHGFVMMSQDFSWTSSKGKLKQDGGGMIAPIKSTSLFELVLSGAEPLYVGNGYW